jgi:hypothetical protein
MDPNLQKFADYYRREIERGKLSNALQDAQSYLEYILGFNYEKIEQELAAFTVHIKQKRKREWEKARRR